MPDFPKLPIITPPPSPFPDLPIITPDPPRLTMAEKYGGLYYLGVAGLVGLLMLIACFGVGLWLTRDYWGEIIVLNTPDRPEADKIRAAWTLAHHDAANDRHRFDTALRKDLPPLSRYILAESLTTEAIRADPKGYAISVARSENWPDWLRLLLLRPLAYGASDGYRIAWEPLDELREHPDPAIALWATYTRAVMPPGDPDAARSLEASASKAGPYLHLATLLEAANRAEGETRKARLDEATTWLRTHHPEASKLWNGWSEQGGQLIETAKSPSV